MKKSREKFKVGVGLRHQHFPYFESGKSAEVDFFEIISENFINTRGRPFEILMKLREEFDICMHGVSLSVASVENVNWDYLGKIKELMTIVEPLVISDHLCFTGSSERNLHNLLPFSYTEANLNRISEKVKIIQDFLGRQFVLENLSAYFSLANSEMMESEFLNELSRITGCGILLDINNLYVNSINQKFNANDWLSKINIKNVNQIHLAGFTDFGDYLFDTHALPVHQPVWDLYESIIQKNLEIPVLIEWDEDIPSFEILQEEAFKARKIALNGASL
jgi:uncharacterized protein (UPF0276 family)